MQGDAPSFEKIDYSLRPAKSTERWMLLEALSRLSVFAPLSDYQYVGFGSPFFVDFRLFHRRLAIAKMVSIESEIDRRPRFELNKPFDCIEMLWGRSTDVLSDVDWSPPTITWLDYDYYLESSVFSDIGQIVDRAKHGDCVLITVEAKPPRDEETVVAVEDGLGELGAELGSLASLEGWGLANVFYPLIHSTFVRATRERGDKLDWVKLWHFHYRDSAHMLTYGGIFVNHGEREMLQEAGFEQLKFTVMDGDDPFVILMPQLTLSETRRIDKHMPDNVEAAVADLAHVKVEQGQVERYARIYRHAPVFHESQA